MYPNSNVKYTYSCNFYADDVVIILKFTHLLSKYDCIHSQTELQKQRLEALTREYSVELEIVCEEFDLERAMLIEQHNVEMNDIADILFAMDQNFQERESEAKSEFQSMRDEIKNKVGILSINLIRHDNV